MTIAGFGSGALVFTPVANALMQFYSRAPTYLGPQQSVSTVVRDGRLFAGPEDALQEVVVATASDIAKLAQPLAEGIYVVGTGATGVAPTLMTISAAYLAIMLTSALTIRRPAAGYLPPGFNPSPSPASPAPSTPSGEQLFDVICCLCLLVHCLYLRSLP